MTNRAKLALIATLAVMRLAATPALGQSYSAGYGTGNELPFNSQSVAHKNAPRHAAIHATRRNELHAYAMEPRPRSNFARHTHTSVDSDDPAFTGGGSVGYNELLKQEGD